MSDALRGAGQARRHEDRLLWAGNRGLFALLEAFRHAGPIHRVPRLGWVVTDPLLTREILNDHGAFSALGDGGAGHLWTALFGSEMSRLLTGPHHAELRRKTRDLFTEKNARRLVERSQGPYLVAMRAWLAAGETVDVADATRVLAGRMVADLMGLRAGCGSDESYRVVFTAGERLAALATGTEAGVEVPAQVIAQARGAVHDLTRGVDEAYAEAGPDTVLGRCRQMGLGLELSRGLATLMAIAGTGTGASATARTVALLHDTGQIDLLLEEPRLVEAAVREGLRVTSAAPVIGRYALRDTSVGGRWVRAGERLLLVAYVAGNALGPFDITRDHVPDIRQLWFGGGRHLCLGAAVARRQLTRMLETLTADGRPVQVVSRRAARGVLVPSYASLRVRLGGPDAAVRPVRRT